jgi:putative SOS response-associated peptidase YedK
MPVYDAPEDEDDYGPRQSYNFAPGYNGIVYRADTPDWGAGPRSHRKGEGETEQEESEPVEETEIKETRYKLQTMKWGRSSFNSFCLGSRLTSQGLIPFWTKRNPDYGSIMKTINCRDDSLIENRGMWTTMKQKKRCIVIAQGFYEWLKKNGGKEKIPHFIKRKDGKLMCMAGLWDCVQYEGSDEKLYSYTIITTDSNKQLSFLHDRMPVILENGSEQLRTWLDPKRYTWSKELQSLLKPYQGELEIYPVSKDVGKVGNNSPTFIVPISSSENKNNIANFFTNPKSTKAKAVSKTTSTKTKEVKKEEDPKGTEIKQDPDEDHKTINHNGTEDNAPLPVPKEAKTSHGIKRKHIDDVPDEDMPPSKASNDNLEKAKVTSPVKAKATSPVKQTASKTRSADSNGTSPAKAAAARKEKGTQKITNFFRK